MGVFFISIFVVTPIVSFLYYRYVLELVVIFTLDLIILGIFFKDSLLRLIFIKITQIILTLPAELFIAILSELIFQTSLAESYSNLTAPMILTTIVYYPVTAIFFIGGAKLINKMIYKTITARKFTPPRLFPDIANVHFNLPGLPDNV